METELNKDPSLTTEEVTAAAVLLTLDPPKGPDWIAGETSGLTLDPQDLDTKADDTPVLTLDSPNSGKDPDTKAGETSVLTLDPLINEPDSKAGETSVLTADPQNNDPDTKAGETSVLTLDPNNDPDTKSGTSVLTADPPNNALDTKAGGTSYTPTAAHIWPPTTNIGFDAGTIMRKFFNIARSNPPPENTERAKDFNVYVDYTDAASDLLFFITVFLVRGTNVEKIKVRSKEDAAMVFERKAAQYGIVGGEKKTKLTPETLTLSRIAKAFPLHTAAIIMGNNIEGRLKTRVFAGVNLPLLMQHTIFASFIPLDHKLTPDLKDIAKILNAEMTILLAPLSEKPTTMSFRQVISNTERFVEAACGNQPLIPDSAKIQVLIKGGILKRETEPISTEGAEAVIEGRVVPEDTLAAMIALMPKIRKFQMLPYYDLIRKMQEENAN